MKSRTSTQTAVYIALMTAFAAVISPLSIPTPFVPLTLQTFVSAFCGYFLGWKKGVCVTALYLLMGALGLPVFAGFRSGIQVLLGPTGGFLFGLLALTVCCGRRNCLKSWCAACLGVVGVFLCHAVGTAWLCVAQNISFWQACAVASFPFLLKDILCMIGARCFCQMLRKRSFFDSLSS